MVSVLPGHHRRGVTGWAYRRLGREGGSAGALGAGLVGPRPRRLRRAGRVKRDDPDRVEGKECLEGAAHACLI